MAHHPAALEHLIDELGRLPGIGRRTARRLAFHLLKTDRAEVLALARALRELKENLRSCQDCLNYSEKELCPICSDSKRDRGLLMVVEEPRDLVAFEETGRYHGLYHLLLGQFAPSEGVDLSHLSLDKLRGRLARGHFREVILATNPTLEGDGTALALEQELGGLGVKLSRLGRGLATGCSIEYSGTEVLAEALAGRVLVGAERAGGA